MSPLFEKIKIALIQILQNFLTTKNILRVLQISLVPQFRSSDFGPEDLVCIVVNKLKNIHSKEKEKTF